MIDLKISMIAVAMIVVTIVHHGSAKDQCERLLTSGSWFKSGNPKGLQNFRTAYKNISPTQIEKNFKISSKDTVVKRRKNKLTQDLMRAFTMYLLSQNKLSIDGVATPFEWCRIKVNNEVRNGEVPLNKADVQVVICHEYTLLYFLGCVLDNHEINIDMKEMFKVMYERFSQDDILADIESRKKDHSDEADRVRKYSLGYFDYIAEDYLYKNVDPKKVKFGSVEDFCKSAEGKNIIATVPNIEGECSH